jgi:hypothetical protein
MVGRARWSWGTGPRLSAIGAAAARDGLYALDLVADLLVKDGVSQEDQPGVTGVGVCPPRLSSDGIR